MDTNTYSLQCGQLSAKISSVGGEICSLCYGDTQLIWQGAPAYWEGSAPFLFPFCGRVKDGIYRWKGVDYPMPIHGFLPQAELTITDHSVNQLTLTLTDTTETRKVYPFPFQLELSYQLTESSLRVTATVRAGDSVLPFSFGAHPGFNLPITSEGFDGARLQFENSDPLCRIEITPCGLLGEGRTDYPLPNGALPLSPDPAGDCGIFFRLSPAQRGLTLTAPALPCDIRMAFADFPVLGLWHAEGAPYLCIEPWQGLPALDGIPTSLAHKPETLWLAPHQAHTMTLEIQLLQKGHRHV